ncbi:MAG TPA: gas vesicle protein GvpG [Thermoanaerobaculia bacterium]|nr:gas vesicle protein GvpG [Thermoanaerobaculia bacterium]
MIIVDSLLVGGLRFILDKVATAVDAEMNDEGRLKEELLAAQMQYELGEIDDDEMAGIESSILARLREIREARGEEMTGLRPGTRVVGVDVTTSAPGRIEFEDED